ncbi:hypothetical protein ACFV8Z_30675 [Streptomyces sp. NPDC059837]
MSQQHMGGPQPACHARYLLRVRDVTADSMAEPPGAARLLGRLEGAGPV